MSVQTSMFGDVDLKKITSTGSVDADSAPPPQRDLLMQMVTCKACKHATPQGPFCSVCGAPQRVPIVAKKWKVLDPDRSPLVERILAAIDQNQSKLKARKAALRERGREARAEEAAREEREAAGLPPDPDDEKKPRKSKNPQLGEKEAAAFKSRSVLPLGWVVDAVLYVADISKACTGWEVSYAGVCLDHGYLVKGASPGPSMLRAVEIARKLGRPLIFVGEIPYKTPFRRRTGAGLNKIVGDYEKSFRRIVGRGAKILLRDVNQWGKYLLDHNGENIVGGGRKKKGTKRREYQQAIEQELATAALAQDGQLKRGKVQPDVATAVAMRIVFASRAVDTLMLLTPKERNLIRARSLPPEAVRTLIYKTDALEVDAAAVAAA